MEEGGCSPDGRKKTYKNPLILTFSPTLWWRRNKKIFLLPFEK
jgi:hypothetical protein